MDPVIAAVVVALGAVFLYLKGNVAPGASSLVAAPSSSRLTRKMVDYFLGGFAEYRSAEQMAAAGASAGLPLAGPTFGISILVGGLAGWIAGSSNYTEHDRNTFAQRLGFPVGLLQGTVYISSPVESITPDGLPFIRPPGERTMTVINEVTGAVYQQGQVVDPSAQIVTSPEQRGPGLLPYLTFMGRDDLRVASTKIGKTDSTGNVLWMFDVLKALDVYLPFQFPNVA